MKMAIQLITEKCRIAAICDVFEALTAKKQYKEPMTSNEALNLMTNFNQIADGGKIMLNITIWKEKKERNSEMCKEIVKYVDLQIMKWVNPQGTHLSDKEMRKIKSSNKILIESGVVNGPIGFEDLVSLVQIA